MTKLDKTGELLGDMLSDSFAEMQKAASMASALVLFFPTICAICCYFLEKKVR